MPFPLLPATLAQSWPPHSLWPKQMAAGTLLGGITFRNVLVRYDRANRHVGFGHASCKDLGAAQRPPCLLLDREGIASVSLCC